MLGLFVGDLARFLRPIGHLYVLLLEVAVYPYLICSLLHGLGSMSPSQAWKLFLSGWKFYVLLWIITFGLLIVLAQGIPQALSTSWVADRATQQNPGLLEILIPSDPFTALARNYVPAVVLFCLLYGVALQHVQEKTALLSALEGIRLASLKFWNAVVQFAPVAVFALFGDLAGTLRPKILRRSPSTFFSFCGELALNILDYSKLHLGVHAVSLQGSSWRSQFRFGDCCCYHPIGLCPTLYFVRNAAPGQAVWN